MFVPFKKLHPDAILPYKSHPNDAAFDLTCVDDGTLSHDMSQITYSFGLSCAIPDGYVGLIFPRSSICKTSLSLSNSVGVIDAGYRGEIRAVFNRRYHEDMKSHKKGANDEDYNIEQVGVADKPYKKGDRIAQIIFMPLPETTTHFVDELPDGERGANGFGSSGS